jgi:hypothetical protein
MKNVLVVGDSTSSSLGGNSENWLRKLEETSTWGEQVRFIDTCAPGVTAAAALFVFVKKLFALRFSIFLVILSVGNCDRVSRPYVANKTSIYRIFFFLIKSFARLKVRKKYNWIKLDFTKWHAIPSDQSKQNLANFDKSLRFIKQLARIFRINLFVIIPRSNLLFPPGTAKNNSLFYDLINFSSHDHPEKISDIPDLTKNTLLTSSISALNFASIHHSDLEVFNFYDKHKIMCGLNNFAVDSFHNQKKYLALECLEQIAIDVDSPSEFVFYNIARIYSELGDQSKSATFFEESLRLDTNSYRVDSLYSNTVNRIFEPSSRIINLNLYDTKFDGFFLDHCHLLPGGQDLIMKTVRDHMLGFIPQGEYKINLVFEPVNPEIGEGDLRAFKDVFGIESLTQIERRLFKGRAHAIDVVAGHLEKFLPKSKYIEIIESAVFYAFTSHSLNLTSNYVAQSIGKERNRIENLSSQLQISLPVIDQLNLPLTLRLTWLDEILKNLHIEIESFIYTNKSCVHRMRTIMSWYFKESLYFGFNSSNDMLYIRNDIRRWKEALFLAISLNDNQSTFVSDRISTYYSIVYELEKLLSTSYKNLDFFKLSNTRLLVLESDIDFNSKKIWEHNFEK